MQFEARNPQDYIVFPSIYKYCEASDGHGTATFTEPATEQLLTGESTPTAPSLHRQHASCCPVHVLPPEKWLCSSQQPLNCLQVCLGTWFSASDPPSSSTNSNQVTVDLVSSFSTGAIPSTGTWLLLLLLFHSSAPQSMPYTQQRYSCILHPQTWVVRKEPGVADIPPCRFADSTNG